MVLLFINIPIFADFVDIYESGSDSFMPGFNLNELLLGAGDKGTPSVAAQFARVSGSLESGGIQLSLDLNSLLQDGIPWFWDGWHKGWILNIPPLGLDPSIFNDMVLTFELILSDGTTVRSSGTIIAGDPATGIALLVGLEGLNLSSCLTGSLNLALSVVPGGETFSTSVPEPGILLLVGVGIVGAFLVRFYYKKNSREQHK